MDGQLGWFWMTFMMLFWVVFIAAVIYVAARLGQRPPGENHS